MHIDMHFDMHMVESQKVELKVKDFDLAKTVDCGQCFRWSRQEDDSYIGVVQGKILHIYQRDDVLTLRPTTLDDMKGLWLDYFDLWRDYSMMHRRIISKGPWMAGAAAAGKGIRILKQDPWETTITFILSANNHIPRISASVASLATRYGDYAGEFQGKAYYGFPSFEALGQLTLEEWQQCGAGYRAPYLVKTAQEWPGCFDALNNHLSMSSQKHQNHRQVLETLPGVGPKVSSCISLYGLGYHRQFPVDVWVRRRVKALWPEAPSSNRDIETKAIDLFGDAAGYAQQLLFYEARLNRTQQNGNKSRLENK